MSDKTNLITNSLITLGLEESEGKGKGRYFQSRFIEAGIAHYEEFGDILITKETLNKFIQSMVGCPVIINHKDVTDKNVDKLRVGTISRVWYNDIDGWFYCEGILTDAQAIDLVKNQGWSVSCSYSFESDNQKKTYHGKEISQEFIDGEFLHLAIVETPRYENANIVVNSKDNIDKKENVVMAAMDDLKEFILSVVNNACKDETKKEEKIEEKEVENEEETKEEVKEEETEEKKAENKCKNEAKEEIEEEKIEEKEEVIKNEEEIEEEKEKEVKNSLEEDKQEVQNSMDEMKDLIMGGNSFIQEDSLYTSQAERLELGNKY